MAIDQIAGLPGWQANDLISVGKQVRRHVLEMAESGRCVLEARQKVNGPFRLALAANRIHADVPWQDVRASLGSIVAGSSNPVEDRLRLFEFVEDAWKSHAALNEGKLRAAERSCRSASGRMVSEELRAFAAYNLAKTLERRGQYDAARQIVDESAGALGRGPQVRWPLAKLLVLSAWLHFRANNLPQAERHYQRALQLIEPRGDNQLLGEIYNGLGLIAARERRHAEAEALFERALERWILSEHFYGIQAIYFNLARVSSALGDRLWEHGYPADSRGPYLQALMWIKQCMSLCARLAIADDVSDDRILLSHVHRRLGNSVLALKAATEARDNSVRAGNERCIALACREIAIAYIDRGDERQALEAVEECERTVGLKSLRFLRKADLMRRIGMIGRDRRA